MAALTPFLAVDNLSVTYLYSAFFIRQFKNLNSIPKVIMCHTDFNLALNIAMLLAETYATVHPLIADGIPFDHPLDITSAYAAMH